MFTNEEYIQEYIQSRGLSTNNTYKLMKIVMNHYSNFQEKTIHELLIEADAEEEQGIRWKRRTLKTRLIQYMNYLKTTMTISSAKTYFRLVKSFYNHHEIEIHKLPQINERNGTINEPIRYQDLPDKKIIQKAIEISNPVMSALLLFLSSCGLSRVDALNLTIQDFIKATSEYHHAEKLSDVIHQLQILAEDMDLIPTFRNRRQKTNKYYVTFCSHEATMEICKYLQGRLEKSDLDGGDKLFKINPTYFNQKFVEINNTLHLGKVGTYNRFRGHMLRKFHASQLEKAGMDRYKINVLQGKSNGAVDDVYFFEDETQLKEEYIKHMDALLIFTEVREVTKYSKEFLEIKQENEELKNQLLEIKQMKKELNELKNMFQ